MPRPLRPLLAGGWYHVTNRGAARQDVFLDDVDRRLFLDLVSDSVWIHQIEVHAYCLMGNHYHLLLHTPHGNLDKALHRALSMYVRKFNVKHRRDGPLFRDRYYSSLIEDESYLLAASRYIHRNPKDLGVANLSGYRWSSYGQYAGKHRRQAWLETDLTLELAGGAKGYAAFVEGPLGEVVDRVAFDLRQGDLGAWHRMG